MKKFNLGMILSLCVVFLWSCTAPPYYYNNGFYGNTPAPDVSQTNRVAVISLMGPKLNYISSFTTAYNALDGGISKVDASDWNVDDYITQRMMNTLQSRGYNVKRYSMTLAGDTVTMPELQNIMNITMQDGYDTVIVVHNNTPEYKGKFNYPGYGFNRINKENVSYNTAVYATMMMSVYRNGGLTPVSLGDGVNTLNTAGSDPVRVMWRNDFGSYSPTERQILQTSMQETMAKKIDNFMNRIFFNYHWQY